MFYPTETTILLGVIGTIGVIGTGIVLLAAFTRNQAYKQ